MIARGQHDPNAFASLMQTHPQIKTEIVGLLQQTLGKASSRRCFRCLAER